MGIFSDSATAENAPCVCDVLTDADAPAKAEARRPRIAHGRVQLAIWGQVPFGVEALGVGVVLWIVQDAPAHAKTVRRRETRGEHQPYQTGQMIKEPFGIRSPLYSSSRVVQCGAPGLALSPACQVCQRGSSPMGATGSHRRHSLAMPCTYGIAAASASSGRRSVPTTQSTSACPFAWTSG
jgi:hypothetical protein